VGSNEVAEACSACGYFPLLSGLELALRPGLAAIGSQLHHDALNDRVEDVLRYLEGIAFRHDPYSLEAGIVQHVASAALGQVQLKLFANLWRHLILEVVSELSEEFLTCDH